MDRMTHAAAGRGLSAVLLVALAGLLSPRPAEAGHESPWYPSFYPQEIYIQTADPAAAASLLQKNSLHAYVGRDPFSGRSAPATLQSVEALGSYVVATANPASPSVRDGQSRCAASREILGGLAGTPKGFATHPYPVTPYHADYLEHYDRVQARRKAADLPPKGRAPKDPGLRIRAAGALAEALGQGRWTATGAGWDVTVEEVGLAGLLSNSAHALNGWLGPPWVKEGWFHAYLLLAGAIRDPARKQRLDAMVQRLTTGAYAGAVERLNLERGLVSLATEGCERTVLGYTLKRSLINNDYSEGIENIAADSQFGLLTPVFIRTVKLKDFPWNGWLRLGTEARPTSAWNPIGGFTDPFGRWVWFTVGEPALFPAPSGGGWIADRAMAATAPGGSPSAKVEVPPDALLPESGSGTLRPVGPRQTARAKVLYRVPLSVFHDGTPMTVGDLIYPYAFAFRWGTGRGPDGVGSDPSLEQPTAVLRRWLAGFRVLRVERTVKDMTDLKLEWQVPVLEVYLRHALDDPQQTAAVAPPWSGIPWHLLALMEQAVARGFAAFSQQEAQRRGAPWLDLVRDRDLHARLASLAEEFERTAYVPEALKGFATPEEARRRWAALRQFAQKSHHFLVTNGPYRLEKWSASSATLAVFRDLSYPLGVGTFDAYVLPPKAHVATAELRGRTLQVAVKVEKAVRAGRSYTWTTEPLTKSVMADEHPVRPVCRYVLVGADGTVRAAGAVRPSGDGGFRVDLKDLPPDRFALLTAVYLNGNAVNPDIRLLEHRAP